VPKLSVIVATRVGLGKVAVNEEATAFSQDCQGIFCNEVNPYFLMWQIKGAANEIISQGQGTTISGITVSKLNEIVVKIPNENMQNKIVEQIEYSFSVCEKIEETINSSLEQAEALRQSILKQAFEGKLTKEWRKKHPDLISGENSAKSLLERIKKEREALKNTKKRKK